VAVPLAVGAQQAPLPVIGFLSGIKRDDPNIDSFRRGLAGSGYDEGRNLLIEYRFADGDYGRLPGLATELVSRNVALIVAVPSSPVALAAKAATGTIPIVFLLGADPVQLGLVASYSRPGGKITGVSVIVNSLTAKRIELLCELVPTSVLIAELVNPINRTVNEELKDARAAARALGRELLVVGASTRHEIAFVFEAISRSQAGGLVVWQEAFLYDQLQEIVGLAAIHRIPAVYAWRRFVESGGLMSYGAVVPVVYRQLGTYAARILNGERPEELPVIQPTAFELLINLKTAKALGLTIPPSLLARADEVIE
jgi:putative tryptophan/tyrosine transport system substrate-binding protein